MRSRASRVRPLLRALLLPALIASVAACGDVLIPPEPLPVQGQGDVVSETRDVGVIDRVSVAAAIDVVIRTGEPGSVTLTAQANLLPLVVTEARDGQLIVNVPAPGYTTTEPVTLTVIAPDITSVTVSGGANGELDVVVPELRVDLSGAATLQGTGRLDRLALTASSDGVASFAELVAGSASITMSGGSAAELAVEGALTGEASGGATVTLVRQPASVNVATSSGGSVQGASPTP